MKEFTKAAALIIACSNLTPPVNSSASHALPRSITEVRLSCDKYIDLPQPVIKVRVEGQDACLLVDTGASDTVLDRSLLPRTVTSTAGHGSEVSGQGFQLAIRKQVSLEVAGLKTKLPQVAYTNLDPGLLADNIRGLLSPERLNTSRSLLLNFRTHTLRAFSSTSEMQSWVRTHDPAMSIEHVPVRTIHNIPYVQVHVSGHPQVWMMLDTGAKRTVLPMGYLKTSEAAPAPAQSGISGEKHAYMESSEANLTVGKISFGKRRLLLPDPAQQPFHSGRVGMDILGETQIGLMGHGQLREVLILRPRQPVR